MSEEKFLTQNSGGLCRNDCYDVFMRELCGADRIVIQTKNALGEFDGYYLSAQHLREAIKNRSADTAAAQVAAAYERAALTAFRACKAQEAGYVDEKSRLAQRIENELRLEVVKAIRALATDTQTNALEQVRRDAERAGYERGVREAMDAALGDGEGEWFNHIQAIADLLDNPTPDPDEPTKAQDLAFRKAVSS